MRNKLTKRIVGGGVVSAIGVVVSSLGGAAAAELSPQDRCAIAKLDATWQEAKCLTDAQVAGIRQGLTDQQVNKQIAACRQRAHASFENAEDLPGKCQTIDDDAAVDYALRLATDIPRACGESGPPCNAENPETLSTTLLHNRTPNAVRATVNYAPVRFFCSKGLENFAPGTIEPGFVGISSAGICLIRRIDAEMIRDSGTRIRCGEYTSSGTGYRTFQVVLVGNNPNRCVVDRP
jgi:hypothetical protein